MLISKILSPLQLYTHVRNECGLANEQAEGRRSACRAASLMPREVLQQAEKFSITVKSVMYGVDSLGILVALDFKCSFT